MNLSDICISKWNTNYNIYNIYVHVLPIHIYVNNIYRCTCICKWTCPRPEEKISSQWLHMHQYWVMLVGDLLVNLKGLQPNHPRSFICHLFPSLQASRRVQHLRGTCCPDVQSSAAKKKLGFTKKIMGGLAFGEVIWIFSYPMLLFGRCSVHFSVALLQWHPKP